jgi:hypothetical protein
MYGARGDLPKDVENRTWQTDYRGPLLIHASKGYDLYGPKTPGFTPTDYPRGAIIGKVDLIDILITRCSQWHEDGLYGWYFKNPVRFAKPIPWVGQLRVYEVPDWIMDWVNTFGIEGAPCR